MPDIDPFWWLAGGGAVLLAVMGYCALILGARIGESTGPLGDLAEHLSGGINGKNANQDLMDTQPRVEPEDTIEITTICPNCNVEQAETLDGKCPVCRKGLKRVDKALWEAKKNPVRTERVADVKKAQTQALEAIAHFTSDPWAENVARAAWTGDMSKIEEAISTPTELGKLDLYETRGSALAVKGPGRGETQVLTIGQTVEYQDPKTGEWRRGMIHKFFEDTNIKDNEDSDKWYVRVGDTMKWEHFVMVPSYRVRRIPKL